MPIDWLVTALSALVLVAAVLITSRLRRRREERRWRELDAADREREAAAFAAAEESRLGYLEAWATEFFRTGQFGQAAHYADHAAHAADRIGDAVRAAAARQLAKDAHAARLAGMRKLVAEHEAEAGPITDEQRTAIDREWPD